VIAATPDEQRRLLDLQEIDLAIRQLRHRRANLPEQKALDDNVDTLRKVGAELVGSTEKLDNLRRQQRRHEEQVAAVDARRKSEEGRMYSGLITSEREVDAIRQEIHSLRGRKNDLEDTLLEIMEQIEELESLVATLQERHDELSGQVAPLSKARDDAATDIDAELADREIERARAVAALPAPVVAYYEDVRARKEGVGVAALQGRTCMGCRLELTLVELEEVKEHSQRRLARCEQCGRILVPS
jgi:uncharacterized protein